MPPARSSSRAVRRAILVYRLLLFLYPSGFRRAYGAEMAQVFAIAYREAISEQDGRAVFSLWLRVLRDMAGSACAEWLIVLRSQTILRPAGRFLRHWARPALTALCVAGVLGTISLIREDSSSPEGELAQTLPSISPYQHNVGLLQDAELTPFTGTSITRALAAPESGIMPPNVTLDIGLRETKAAWSVRDRTHYRIVLHRIAPAIESGTITIVANGRTVTTYDDRTNTASVVSLSAPSPGMVAGPDPFFIPRQDGPNTAPSLTALIGGSELLPPGVVPNPSQPRGLLEHTILETPYGTVGLTGHARLLGHKTDVFTLRPLYTFVWSTCTPPSRTGCAHPTRHQTGFGWDRLWIDRAHPFMLRDLEGGVPLQERQAPERTVFRVLSGRYGEGPTAAMLRYYPPVQPVREPLWCLGCTDIGGWTSWQPRRFQGLFDFPPPRGSLHLPRLQVFDASDSPLPRTSGVDLLYSTGSHHDYFEPRALQQIYALGPYLYI